MKQAIIYTRVSTARQADEGISLDAQAARCREWARAMGHDIAGEYIDAGISGGKMTNRPGLQDALDAVTASGGVLVTYSLSRLARSTRDALDIAERLDRAGADLVSLSESIDTTSAAGKMVFRMLAVLAEFERDLISERTRGALAHKRANGYKTGGKTPYGFTADASGKLHAHPVEQENIKLMKRLRAKGYSLQKIADELRARGIITRRGNETWQLSVVSDVLRRAA